MKKTGFVIIILLLILTVPVSADYIYVPSDEFWSNHMEECTEHNKYYNNSDTLDIYVNPAQSTPYHQAPANQQFLIKWLYTDENGVLWGNQGMEVWIKMEDLDVLYSHDEFIQEHQTSITEISEKVFYEPGGYIALYNYPNSDWINGVIATDWTSEDYHITLNLLYTDEKGVQWVYENYFKEYSGWFKLNDPVSENRISETHLSIYNPHKQARQNTVLYLVIGLCAVTGGVYVILKKKK